MSGIQITPESPHQQQRQYISSAKRDPATGRPTTQLGKIKDATAILSETTVAKAAQMTTSQVTKAVKDLWEDHKAQWARLADLSRECSAEDLRRAQLAQTEEVFLVIASLGEKLLELGVFNSDAYPHALADTVAALASAGLECLPECYEKVDAQVKFPVTAAMIFCACFYPMHVYRGYGAALLDNWDWGCPDLEALEKEKIKEQGSWLARIGKAKPVIQSNQQVLEAFDRTLLSLQSKTKSKDFLSRKPPISGLVAGHPRYGKREKKDFKKELELLEDFTKEVNKRGYPGTVEQPITSWAIPFATWRSKSSCTMVQSWEDVLAFQMDPGRLLHAYLHRNVLSLTPNHMVVLPPGTLSETLACWLEGLPGTDHHILRWASLETAEFAKKMKKADKNVWRKLGQYPLPNTFVIRGLAVPKRPSSAVAATPTVTPNLHVEEPIITTTRESVQSNETTPVETQQRLATADTRDAAPPPYAPAESGEGNPTRPVAITPDDFSAASPSSTSLTSTEIRDSKASISSITSDSTLPRDSKPSISSMTSKSSQQQDNKHNTSSMASSPHSRSGSNPSIKRKPAPVRQSSQGSRVSPISSVSEESGVANGMRHSMLASPTAAAAVSESYLDLLNEVANGAISPQQLQQILHYRQNSESPVTSYFATGASGKQFAASPEQRPLSTPIPSPSRLPLDHDRATVAEKDSRELSLPWGLSDGSYLPTGTVFELPTERDPVETDGTPVARGASRSKIRTNTTVPVTFRASGKEAVMPDDGKEVIGSPTTFPTAVTNDANALMGKVDSAIEDVTGQDQISSKTSGEEPLNNEAEDTPPDQCNAEVRSEQAVQNEAKPHGLKYPRTGIMGVNIPESLRPERPLPYPV